MADLGQRMDELRRREREAAANNVALHGRNPAEVARAARLAKRFGVATPLVETQPEVFEAQERRHEAEQAISGSPWMAPFLANNPDTAAALSPDIGRLGNLTKILEGPSPLRSSPTDRRSVGTPLPTRIPEAAPRRIPPRPKMGNYRTLGAELVASSAMSAVARTVSAVVSGGELAADLVGLNEETNDFFRGYEQYNNSLLEEFRPDWIAPGSTMEGVHSGLTSTVQFLMPLPFGKARVLPFLTGLTGLTAYGKYQGMGESVGTSLIGGGAEAAIENLTERLPLKYLFGDVTGGLGKQAAKYLLSEFGGEWLATGGQMAVETAIGPKTWAEYWEELPSAAYQTLIATATMSALVGGGGAAMYRFDRQVDTARQGVEALHGQTILDEMMKRAEGVETRKTARDDFVRLVNEGAKASPVKNVYLPIEAVDAVLADETIPDEEKAALTVYQSQIEEARVNNGEVVIPIGEAAATFAGTKMWQGLREDARVLAGGISGREAREQMDKIAQELESIGTDAVREAKELQPQIQAKAAVYHEVKRQVLAARRGAREAQTTAVLMASRAEALASDRYGQFKDAQEAWNWMKLQIQGPASPAAKGKARKLSQPAFEDVSKLLERDDWAILTAENPEAQQLSPEENAARLAELKSVLDAMGLKYTQVRGVYDNEENSLAIEGITEAQATALGARFGQDSVLTRSGLVYRDGTVSPARGVNIIGADADNYFTELPTGLKFAVDIDFDVRVPARGATLYHGTPFDFDTFADNGKAVWLAESPDLAATYAKGRRVGKSSGDRIIPVRVNISRPLLVDRARPEDNMIEDPVAWARDNFGFDLPAHGWERTGPDNMHTVTRSLAFAQAAREAGYDSIGTREGTAMTWGILTKDAIFSSITPNLRLYQSYLNPLEMVASAQGAFELARGRKFKTIRDFKIALQDAVKATKVGNLRDRARLTRLALADAQQALLNNANAVGWYNEKVEQALAVFGTIHPEILTDEDAKFAFIYALAVTSNGLKVDRNFKLADIVYREYKKTGKMPVRGEGTAQESMEGSLALFNELTGRMSIAELREFMLSTHTVKEIEQKLGVTVGGEHKDTVVTGAAFLGPKIGNGFFSNLYGNFDQLTMDRWFIRTWGRWTGTLVTSPPKARVSESRQRVIALMRSLTPEQKKVVEAALSNTKLKFKIKLSDPESFAERVFRATSKKQVRDILEAVGGRRLRLDPKNYYTLLDGQKEAPQGPAERNEIRSIMGPVLEQLRRDNPELTMADLQAVLWYPEKTLYDTAKAKVGEVKSEGYENDEAPDYANAAVALARSEGVSEEDISAAISRANGRVAAARRAGGAGRGTEQVRSEPRFAEDENGFPLEEGLSSEGDGTSDPTTYQQFGGRVGATNDTVIRSGLTKFFKLAATGQYTEEELWLLTGWTEGPDGQLRFEIDDSQAEIASLPSPTPLRHSENTPGIDYGWEDPRMAASSEDGDLFVLGEKLGTVLNHPTLFKLYPQLADMPVFVMSDLPFYGSFDGFTLVLSDQLSPGQMLSTLLHEIQHAIQTIEGFAGGASPNLDHLAELGLLQDFFRTLEHHRAINRGEIPGMSFPEERTDAELQAAAAFSVYHRVAGEVEARNTQTRRQLTAEQRRSAIPELTADYDRQHILLPQENVAIAAQSVGGPVGPRGEASFYPDGRTIITLFGKADFSTMLHELSHVFLEQEFRLAQKKGASDQLKADVERLKKWFSDNGFPVGEDGKIPVEAHELFARTGERYFREGKAPSVELRPAFKQYKEWLTGIYKSVKDLLAYGPAPINPEISEIFDRIIATDEAIAANASTPMSQEELGMTEAEYAAYLDSVQGARDKAYDTLLERMMKAIRRRESGRVRAQRATVRAEVADEVNSEPVFIALHLLRTGRWLNDPERGRESIKLHTGWLIDNYGEEVLRALPVGLQPLHRGDGVVGDVIAEMVGLPSGDALVQGLLELKRQADALKATGNTRPLRDQIIEDRTDQIMAERHGDIAMSEAEIEEEAIAALNANRQGEVLAAELRQLRKKNARPGAITPYQMLREWARRKVNEGTVADAISKQALQRYIRGYNKARNLFEEAILAKKPEEAIKQKQAQMINHALLAEGKVVADEISAIVKRMQRYAKTKALASIDQDYMDRIHELLEGYNFRSVSDAARAEKASFEEWAARQREAGHEVHVPERFRDDRTNWKDAQVSKLLELNDMVQSLVSQGRLKQRLTSAREERELRATVDDAESRILNLPPRVLPEASTGRDSRPLRQALREAKTFSDYRAAVANLFRRGKGRELAAGLIKVEGLMDLLDGTKDATGPLNRHVVQPATEAANTFSRLLEEVMDPIVQRYRGMSKKQAARMRDFVTIPELTLNVSIHEADTEKLGQPLTIPRSQLLGLIANTGNLSNLSKLVGGERWGDPESATDLARVRDILVSHASKEDMDLVQDMWDGVAKLWPHIARVERELTGVVPEQVVPMEIETPYGTYSGGYWPVVWDSTRSEMGRKQGEEAETSLMGVGFGIGTPKGHTITRTGAVAPMSWSLEHVLFGHLNKVISRIAYAPWIRDTLKLVDNPRITGAIRLRLGDEYVKMIKPWIRDQIPSNWQDTQGAVLWEKFLNQTRVNMSIAVLGVSYSTGIAQLLGLGYSAGVLGEGSVKDGGKWVAIGIGKMLQLQKSGFGGAQEFVFERSEEMRRRFHEMNQEASEVFRRLKDTDSAYHKLQAAAFWHIGFIDMNMVALPTWLGGYHKALSQGMSEQEAVAYAEKMVRLSQSSGRKKDLSAIQRGNAGQKFISMFYTPSSVFFNQQWEAVQHLKAGNWSNALAPTFWFLVMTTIADAMREGDWPEDDDDDGLGGVDIAEWVARNILFGLFYGIPVVRDATNATERKMRGEYAEYGTTPLTFAASTIERGHKSGKKMAEGEETEGRDLKNIVAMVGFLFGLPGNQIGKTSGFLEDVRTGKAQPEGFGDWYQGITSGKIAEDQE